MTDSISPSRRWLALGVVCLGVLMVVLDVTIVNVALPSIRADLGFSETTLVWVVNAYLLTCGGFLLLGGRLGDLYGHRRSFRAASPPLGAISRRMRTPPPRFSSRPPSESSSST
jgi:MFS family permease